MNRTKSKHNGFLSLRHEIVLGIIVSSAMILAVVMFASTFGIPFTSYNGSYGHERDQVLQYLSLVADLKKERLEAWLQEAKGDISTLSSSRSVGTSAFRLQGTFSNMNGSRGGDKSVWQEIIRDENYANVFGRFQDVSKAYERYTKIQLAAAETGLVLVSTERDEIGQTVRGSGSFQKASQKPNELFVEVENDPLSKKTCVILATTIGHDVTDQEHKPEQAPIILAYVDMEKLVRPMLYVGKGVGGTGEILLVSQDRIALMSLKHPLADGKSPRALEYRIDTEPAGLAAQGQNGIVEARDYRGVPVLAAYRFIPVSQDRGWGMVVKQDTSEVLADLWSAILYTSAIGIVGILLACVLALGIGYRISKPIDELSEVAQEVASGNMDVKSKVYGPPEIRSLARTLNIMIDRVRNWHDELGKQVNLRTGQLRVAYEELYKETSERNRIEHERGKALETVDVLEKIFSTTHFCTVLLDRDFNFIRVNQAYADSCGYPPEFFPGKNHFDLYPHEENESIFRHVVDTGETFTVYAKPFEFPDDPDRGVTYWDWTLHPVKDSSGRVEGLVFILLEVTERQLAEEKLRESEERFRNIFEQGPLGMALVGLDYRFLNLNQAFSEITGYSNDDLGNVTCMEITYPDDVAADVEQAQKLLSGETSHYRIEKRFIRKTGEIVWVNLTRSIMRESRDKTPHLLTMVEDITVRKLMQDLLRLRTEDLARSNADLEQFAYVASHDLQEPLRNVAGCMQLLQKKYKDKLDADADQYIGYAVESVVRMKALIQDLLTFSRISTRGKPLGPTDCEQVLDKTVQNLGFAISEAGAVITHDPLPTISADDTQLLQVFQNLVANAIKFRREESPRVHVSAARSKDGWTFSFKDNGIGIESEYWDRIFVVFQRLHKRALYDGTGIGLAIVKKIVERHHGRIWVESELGVGTTFYFTIPDDEVRT